MLLSITAAYLSLIGAEIENSLTVWCQSSGIFLAMARPGSLPPCPILCPAAVGAASCQVLGGTCAFQLWNVRDAVQEGGVSWDRNQTSSTLLLHCSNAVGAAAAGSEAALSHMKEDSDPAYPASFPGFCRILLPSPLLHSSQEMLE